MDVISSWLLDLQFYLLENIAKDADLRRNHTCEKAQNETGKLCEPRPNLHEHSDAGISDVSLL
jgi:hypothetical protein